MTPEEVDAAIRTKFRVKKRDTLPFTGWLKSNRKHLAELYRELGYKVGAEIGVQRGHHARTLCNNVKDLKLFCIDTWEPYNKIGKKKTDEIYAHCLARLKRFKNVEFMKMTSMEAVKLIPDRSLDFVYIDGLHEFDPVIMDIVHWSQKVRFGGIVAGHDYYAFYQGGVMKAVNAYTRAHNINDWYVTTADTNGFPSWFWVQKEEYQQGYPVPKHGGQI